MDVTDEVKDRVAILLDGVVTHLRLVVPPGFRLKIGGEGFIASETTGTRGAAGPADLASKRLSLVYEQETICACCGVSIVVATLHAKRLHPVRSLQSGATQHPLREEVRLA